MHPESPQLNATGSMSNRSGSPVKQSFGMRHLLNSAQAEEKLNNVHDGTIRLQESLADVGERIREAMVEFGELAYRSRDNGVALTALRDKLNKTQETANKTAADVSDGLARMSTVIEGVGERQNVATHASTQVLDYVRDVARRIKGIEATVEGFAGPDVVANGYKAIGSQSEAEKILAALEGVAKSLKGLESNRSELETTLKKVVDEAALKPAGDPATAKTLEAVQAKLETLNASASESKRMADKMLQRLADDADAGRRLASRIEGLEQALGSVDRAISAQGDSDDKGRREILRALADGHDRLSKELKTLSEKTQATAAKSAAADKSDPGTTVKDLESTAGRLEQGFAKALDDKLAEHAGTAAGRLEQGFAKALDDKLAVHAGTAADAAKRTDECLKHVRTQLEQVLKEAREVRGLHEQLHDKQAQDGTAVAKSRDDLEKLVAKLRSDLEKLVSGAHDKHSTLLSERHRALESSIDASLAKSHKTLEQSLKALAKDQDQSNAKPATDHAELLKHLDTKHESLHKLVEEHVGKQLAAVGKQLDALSETPGAHQAALDALAAKHESQIKAVEQAVGKQLDKLAETVAAAQNGQEMDKIVAKAETESAVAAARDEISQVVSSQLDKLSTVLATEIKAVLSSQQQTDADTLRKQIDDMQAEKERLASQLGELRAEIRLRTEEFDRLEQRAAQFETRLNSAVVSHSKSVLGSATLTLINSAPNNAPRSEPERHAVAKRNLSMIPADQPDSDHDKENELTVAKRGSPFSASKARSVSLFHR